MHNAIISAEVVSILNLSIIIFGMLRRENKQRTSIAFIICLWVAVFGVGMDLLSYVLEFTSVNSFCLVAVNMLSFMGYDFELMAFAFYVWTIVTEKEKSSMGFAIFIMIACPTDILFVIIGTVTQKLFRIEYGHYVIGPLYNLGGVIGFIVLIGLLIFAINNRKTVGNMPVVFVVIFFAITYVSIIITHFTGLESYLYVCMSFIMLLVYIILQGGEIENSNLRERIMFEMSTTDVLTGLNNRRAFEDMLAEVSNVQSIGVIVCDINGLKKTNDNLGHAAGDALLIRFAELLKRYFSSSEIFRISGDEFFVLRYNVEEDAFFSDVTVLRNDIAEQNDIASVGSAHGSGSNVLDLISVAEKDMYDDKKAYYENNSLDRRKIIQTNYNN